MSPRRRIRSVEEHVAGVLRAERSLLAQTITLTESLRPPDRERAQAVLQALLPHTGHAIRIGLTGVPGVGKSTLIDALGMMLLEKGHRVAVLAVDPSSSLSGGSILGDKTRMHRLSMDPRAFIRPSPSGLNLGGVARRTREAILLCEAAGFDVILVETVGVGQSETVVADMVDVFLVLMLPNAGDELQGIKKGILELADLIAINKADGDNLLPAQRAQREYAAALRYLPRRTPGWSPPVQLVSALSGDGLPLLWDTILRHRQTLLLNGALSALRAHQQLRWMWASLEEALLQRLRQTPEILVTLQDTQDAVREGRLPPTTAADQLLETFLNAQSIKNHDPNTKRPTTEVGLHNISKRG